MPTPWMGPAERAMDYGGSHTAHASTVANASTPARPALSSIQAGTPPTGQVRHVQLGGETFGPLAQRERSHVSGDCSHEAQQHYGGDDHPEPGCVDERFGHVVQYRPIEESKRTG